MSDQLDLSADLLEGAQAIAQEIHGKSDKKTIRKVYHERPFWPIFKLPNGALAALKSRLRAHAIALSLEKESAIAAAAEEAAKAAAKPHRRRRTRPIKAP
jgi:hypothetical protein